MTIDCYSQRLLNPFRGISCTIRFESAEAVTIDGHHWDIYVRNELMLDDLDANERHKVLTNDIRYGSWSPEQGLKRGPIYPSDDFKLLEHFGDQVYRALLQRHQQLPFPLQDSFELWLLDEHDLPLALIDSVTEARHMDLDQIALWRPGQRCSRGFRCRGFDELADPVKGATTSDYLGRYVNQLAGKKPSAQWLRRHADGSGTGLQGIHLDRDLEGRELEAGIFPPLLLQTEGHDETHSRLIKAFLAWQAPWLLLLPHLQTSERARFEELAQHQATAVAEQFRLYPEIIDQRYINSARVEARIRDSNTCAHGADESDHSIYYSELTGSE